MSTHPMTAPYRTLHLTEEVYNLLDELRRRDETRSQLVYRLIMCYSHHNRSHHNGQGDPNDYAPPLRRTRGAGQEIDHD